ncbi:MAG TPA: toll/interleukin-1 receptor domain-containing protein [Solirubrobacteraceae bacterium]|nr:toll/interleukin-1 receptor domain-containing protein [Solirubrobacteraceae bacterium]
MNTEAAAAFWSYTHLDNDAEGQRIVQLAHDLKAQYGALSGGELTLFLDVDEIEWGERLRIRIDEALTGTTFFVPIITPRYFMHEECRRELIAFAQETKKLKVEALLLPVYYTDVPELSGDDPSDPAMRLVKEHKYEDWRDLCMEDVSSAEYRKGVRRLAQRLVNVVRDLTGPSQPGVDADSEPGEGLQDADDDEPGLVELLAEGEDAIPEWSRVIQATTPEIEKIGILAQGATEEMARSDEKGEGAKGRLRVAIRLAEQMKPHAEAILRLGQHNANLLLKVDPAITTLLGQVEADPETASQTEGVPEFIESIKGLAQSGKDAVDELRGLSASFDRTAQLSRTLRPSIRDLQTGLRSFTDAQTIYEEWDARIASIESPQR